jgi:hypothetical protein
MKLVRLAVFVAAFGIAGPASAEPLSIAFDNGRVTLKATDVPLRQILQEWARLGQTRVVGLEKLAGAPVTIELTAVPERHALEVLLRSIAGYVAAPRLAAAAPGQRRAGAARGAAGKRADLHPRARCHGARGHGTRAVATAARSGRSEHDAGASREPAAADAGTADRPASGYPADPEAATAASMTPAPRVLTSRGHAFRSLR